VGEENYDAGWLPWPSPGSSVRVPGGLIHRSAWKVNSANFVMTEFYEVRLGQLLRTRVHRREKLASLGAANPAPHVPSLDDEMVGGLPEANDDELGYLRAKEVRGVR
jgi:hypothetical protein